jgi:hypothetical protein
MSELPDWIRAARLQWRWQGQARPPFASTPQPLAGADVLAGCVAFYTGSLDCRVASTGSPWVATPAASATPSTRPDARDALVPAEEVACSLSTTSRGFAVAVSVASTCSHRVIAASQKCTIPPMLLDKARNIALVGAASPVLLDRSSCPQPSPEEFSMNLQLPRRAFLMTLAASGAALATGAQAQALVDEKDAQAGALGYVADAKRVDVKKYPKFAAGQSCGSCALYQGKAGEKAGGCPLFAGKQVAATGWCSAWSKKA